MTRDWTEFLSNEAKLRQRSVMSIPKGDVISLAVGLPNPACFPLKGVQLDVESPQTGFAKTARIGYSVESHPDQLVDSCQYMSSKGLAHFDEWVHAYVDRYFQPAYAGWGYLVQSGATQSLDALFRMLINPDEDTVLCEQLTYSCFLETCVPFRVKLFSVAMDENGVVPEKMDELLSSWTTSAATKGHKKPKVFYTMPTGHNPTGITLSKERRQALLDVCSKHNILIIEDDPYYHLQLDSAENIDSLLKFDTEGRVIRIDSFSKMLMPGLRVSIVTANTLFISKLSMHNELSIHSASANSQLVLEMIFSQWGADGFDAWLKHLQGMYRKRRDIMLDAFDKYLPPSLVTYNRPNHGMFIWINARLDKFVQPATGSTMPAHEWASHVEDEIFRVASEKYKVVLTKGHWFMQDKTAVCAGFRATYAYASDDEMVRGAELFGKAVADVHAALSI